MQHFFRIATQPACRWLLAVALLAAGTTAQAQTGVRVGTAGTPDASAVLDVNSTTQGMLVPRLSASQRGLIASPATGLLVYQTDAPAGFYFYNGTAWASLTGSAAAAYPNVELNTANTSAQTISALMGTTNYNTLSFSSTNNLKASLTSGNTWNGNTFTVGSTGAGWYEVTMQLLGVATNGSNTNAPSVITSVVFLDKNDALTTSPATPANITSTTANTTYPYAYGNYVLGASSSNAYVKNATYLHAVIYLGAGEYLTFRAQSASTSTASNISTDGSSNLTIVRLK